MKASPRDRLLHDLEAEVEAEVELVEASEAAATTLEPASMWQFDPTDITREQIGLQNLIGAVDSLDGRPGNHPDGPR